MSTNTKVFLNGNHYKGASGEGTIYARAGKAYKIYVIAEADIKYARQFSYSSISIMN